jgi:hypothetical protein
MGDIRDPKGKPPAARWPVDAKASGGPAPAKPGQESPGSVEKRTAGRVKHDERGNAVWDWLKETGRFCVESTSALLRRLEVPELRVEGQKDESLRLENEGSRDEGGGYDPYNQKTPTPVRKLSTSGSKPPTRK